MSKRGQFTLFVVLGIVLLLLVGLFFVFKNDILNFAGITQGVSYPTDVQEVVDHVQECVDASAYEAVVNIGYTGGYFTLPQQSYVADSYAVPYYIYDGEDIGLSSDQLQSELNDYIETLVNTCVDFEQFSDFIITTGEFSLDSQIEQDVLSVSVNYPLTVAVGETSYSIAEPYDTEVEANLGLLHSVALQIVAYDLEHPDDIDYSALLSYGVSNILVAPVDNSTYIYMLQDTTSFGGTGNMTFFFAEHYIHSESECFIDLDCEDGFSCVDDVCVEEEG